MKEEVKTRINEALKAGDEVRVSTLKMLSAALTNAEIAKRPDKLSKEDELKVVQKEAKKRKDAIEIYTKAGAKDKADRETEELKILQEYLPKELSDAELEKIVTEVIKDTGSASAADMGKAMGAVMSKVNGKADGGKVSELVKSKLS